MLKPKVDQEFLVNNGISPKFIDILFDACDVIIPTSPWHLSNTKRGMPILLQMPSMPLDPGCHRLWWQVDTQERTYLHCQGREME